MKKTLLLLVALISATIAFAQTEINGIYYNLNDETKTAEVTYSSEYSGDITIPEKVTYNSTEYSVTSIGFGAFQFCSSLTSITIPNSVTSIGYAAFYECTSLTSITIPNNVTSIGEYAFYDCDALTSISIPNSVTSIGNVAFYGTPWLNNQPDGCLYIGKCLYLYKGKMPENTHINVKEGTTMICGAAFSSCRSLTSITIPNSVTSIRDYAFSYCSSLTSITIPNSVTSIGGSVFDGTPWLNNQPDGCLYIGKCLYQYRGEMPENTHIDVNEGTTMICSSAFDGCSSLTSITIPNSVTYIGSSAFDGCSSLTSITIPNSVTSIGDVAFASCVSLTSITIPNSVTSIGGYAFYYCSSLTSITIPNSVTEVGAAVFYNCNSLKSVILSENMTSLPSFYDYDYYNHGFFENCIALTSITIPNSVTSIGERAFDGCESLDTLICNCNDSLIFDTDIDYNPFKIPTLRYLTAPAVAFNTFTEENQTEFSNKLTEVHITDGELNENGFNFINRSYKSLHTIDLAGATNTTINDLAFYDCYKLENLTLPKNVETIGYKAFADCKHLTELTIPASVTEIGESAFENCRSINTLTFEEGSQLETISSWAFYNNHALESIELPEGITEIGDAAFYGCNYVEEIVIPASVQRIGDNGFALCNQVKRMEVRATTPPTIEAKTFHQVSRDIEFIVPAEARNAYAEDEYWREFIQEAPTNVENTTEGIEIYTQNGTLHIEGATENYHILDAAGRLIYSGNATTLTLPRGIYLVTINGEVEKIVL